MTREDRRTSATLRLTAMAHGGEALGRHEGRVVFVAGGIPGEEVSVEIVEEKTHWARGRLLDVVRPSPHRIAHPQCPHFGDSALRFQSIRHRPAYDEPQTGELGLTRVSGESQIGVFCGGCQWQHIDYASQLELKRQVVVDQLTRLGRVTEPLVRPVIGMDEPWYYRNHAQFHVGPRGELGFVSIEGDAIVPIEVCYILHPRVFELFEALELEAIEGLRRVALRAGIHTGDQMMVLELEGGEPPEIEVDLRVSIVLVLEDGTPVTLVGNPYFTEELCGRTFRISATSFFQVNTAQAERLVEVVRQYADLHGHESLLDVYCGVGTFGLCLAGQVGQVTGIEANPSALADARANAAGLDNVRLIEGVAEEILPSLDRADVVIIDPPRQGCAPGVVDALIRNPPRRLIYVACEPATLARDIRRLVERGYHLVEAQPIDLFPQTYHIETVALLQK